MDINDLRKKRKDKAEAMQTAAQALTDLEMAETRDEEAITAAQAVFDAAEAAFNASNDAVTRAESVEAAQALAAQGGDQALGGAGAGGGMTVAARPANPADKGIELGFLVGALANNKGDATAAAAQLDDAGHSGVSAILSGASSGAGGVTIPEPLAETVIDLLRPKVVVRKAGAGTAPVPAGKMRQARLASGSTASYGSEAAPAVASQQSFDSVDHAFRKLTALVGLSNDLIRMSSAAVARIARNDVVRQMAAREDIAFLRNDGTAGTPKGARQFALDAGNWKTEASRSVAAVEAFLRACVSRVEDADVPMDMPGWAMRAGTKNFLAGLRDAAGHPVYPSIDKSGELHGFPIHTSSQIPNNLGSGADTEITFADWSEAVVGDSLNLTIATSDVASFIDADGQLKSAFQNDLTVMRAISEHDFAFMHDPAVTGGTVTGWSI